MILISRRSMILGAAALAACATLPVSTLAHVPGRTLLERRPIPLARDHLTFRLSSFGPSRSLSIRTPASGFWLYSAEFLSKSAGIGIISINRSTVPNKDIFLTLSETDTIAATQIRLHFAFLPLSPAASVVELWGHSALT
jgi:hypothetical protein